MGSHLLTDFQHQNKPLGLLLEKWRRALPFFLRFKFLEIARSQKSRTQKLKGHFKRMMPSWPRCQQCEEWGSYRSNTQCSGRPTRSSRRKEVNGVEEEPHIPRRGSMVDSGKVGKDRAVGRIGGGRERWREADPCHQPGQPFDICQGYPGRQTVTAEVSLHIGTQGRWLR